MYYGMFRIALKSKDFSYCSRILPIIQLCTKSSIVIMSCFETFVSRQNSNSATRRVAKVLLGGRHLLKLVDKA